MKSLLSRFAVSAIAVCLVSGVALAEKPVKKRKIGFFESLFGPSEYRKKKVRIERRPWWERADRSSRYDDGEYWPEGAKKRKKKRQAEQFADSDPEPIPGFGMGNVPYIPAKLLLVADPGLMKLSPETPEPATVFAVLSASRSDIRAEAAERTAILDHYKSTGFKPVWLEANKPSGRALKILAVLSKAAEDGLDPQNYLPPVLTSFENVESQLTGNPEKLAQFDVGLTAAVLKYARHVSGGQFEANRLSLYHDLPSQRIAPNVALKVLAWTPYPEAYLASLHPTHEAYAALKAALALAGNPAVTVPAIQIPQGKRVKPGRRDARMELVRVRLQSLDLLAPADALVAPEDADLLDPALSDALKAFQKSAKIKVTGALDTPTIAALNSGQKASERNRIAINMERLRWLPRELGRRHVFVNQAAFEVRVIDQKKEVWASKVIVGKPNTQTAVFSDQMETVVFNPSWGVPPSIMANEYLPKLRRDPGYLDRIGFKVLNERGKVVSSRSVNWGAYGNTPPFGIQQPPGNSNALGELKFLFPNSHHIYMHDTPTKNLFDRDSRAFSHGCVRVQNPREFAQVVLGWDALRVDEETEGRKTKNVKLPEPIPVHLAYFTAWPDSSGKIRYFDDIYGRDAALERAALGLKRLNRPATDGKIVQN
jgi:murein L,D-transpeptidase YcbB/YkuD